MAQTPMASQNSIGTLNPSSGKGEDDGRLDALMDRIHQLTMAQSPPRSRPATEPPPEPPRGTPAKERKGEWLPIEPDTLSGAGLTDGEVEALILKTLNGRAEATGRYLSDHLK